MASAGQTPRRITASAAISAAHRVISGKSWELANLSNTGVIGGSVTAPQFSSPAQGLMNADGTAGQWVVEFFENKPRPVHRGGQRGTSFPYRRVLVTATHADELPSADVALPLPQGLRQLDDRYVLALDRARKLADSVLGKRFDVLSVASWVNSAGKTEWDFRFYSLASGSVVGQIWITGDGKSVVPH